MTHRTHDPVTSRLASASVDRLGHRAIVLQAVRWWPLTASEVAIVLKDRCSPESVRGRLCELRRAGLVRQYGYGRNRSGRMAARWLQIK